MVMPTFHPLSRRDLVLGCAALGVARSPSMASGAEPSGSVAARATPEPVPDLVAGLTAFALDLLAELRREIEGNILFSPYSVFQALAMSYSGARGETAAQMSATLGVRSILPS